MPFERLVEELKPQRAPGKAPLFNVLFVLQNAPMPPLELPGLRLTVLDPPSETAKFDLTLFIAATSHGLAGSFSYRTDLFDAGTIGRLSERLLTLLRDATEHPDHPISDLSLTTQAERRAHIAGSTTTWRRSRTGLEVRAAAAPHALLARDRDRLH